ncbi:hypothetical protein GGR42_002492 [Saonia flava]|uniref:Adenylosuccinate lyase n=1 Tax=Saonia flava TaxID=523696 RepID=A0A846QUT3_9FLAO|nr:adenylosuccinate lyase [Saonia flava]NJB72001.1 hypothetical protein [Saonia flava]
MTKEELYNSLNFIDHTREKRGEMAKIILANPELIRPLMEIVFMVDDPISTKACWGLEFSAKHDIHPILPHIDYFIKNIHTIKHESSIRPMAKMCELMMLEYFKKNDSDIQEYINTKHLEQITTACFDWLIGDHKVAAKAHSMTCLLLIGSKFPWIHPELKMVLEQNYADGSAAYKARARHTLAKLK